ncbi:polymerase protein [Medicago cytorhabdovirus A]|nr:polymerase protein [Medicago cytorhabdovirus A]
MDFLAFNNDEHQAKVNKAPLPDYHLRNPIKPLLWLHDDSRLTSRSRADKAYLSKLGVGRVELGSHIDLYLTENMTFETESTLPLEDAIADLIVRLKIDVDIMGGSRDVDVDSITEAVLSAPKHLWGGMRFWGRVLSIMNARSSKRPLPPGHSEVDGVVRVRNGSLHVTVLNTGILINRDRSKYLLYDGDWVRLAADVYTQRYLYITGTYVGLCINPSQYPSIPNVESVIRWGDRVLSELGNEGFKVLKTYEALVLGVIQLKGEAGVVNPARFLNNTLQDLFDDSPTFHRHATEVVQILQEINNLHELTQLYGLHRIWGHPMVNSAKGMEKVMMIGQKEIIKDDRLAADAGRMFKLLFCKEYKSKHGQYPPVREYPSRLVTELLEGEGSAVYSGRHSLEDWDRVKFQQCFQLPETFNLSMIVADKSISPTLSELKTLIKTKKTVMSQDKRRGVKRWLEDTTLDPKLFLEQVNRGEFPDDHKVIGLTPKERELNPTPRMFALMSHLLRVYVVLTEQLISDHILKYFPQITMTDSLLDLTKKMFSTVKHQSVQNKKRGKDKTWASKVICMSLDFEKWNGHMRKSMTSGVFTALGDLFGMSELYNQTYDIFGECYYYLADGTYVPGIEGDRLKVENPSSFTGHKGGMEGLRQKGWTLFTVCGLEVILSQHDCTYKIMGMGDNQVLQITLYTNKVDNAGLPTDEGLREIKVSMNDIFHKLIETFTDAGLPLKPLETWMSEDLYVYGKVPIWRGVPLPMDLKKIMRMFPFSNADVMTLENALSTVSGNALSATQASACIWTPYVMCILMNSLCIKDFMNYHPLLGEGLMSGITGQEGWTLRTASGERYDFSVAGLTLPGTRSVSLCMQMIPRTLTGYNGINILEMMMRGFPDNLSRDVSYIMSVIKSDAAPTWLVNILKRWVRPIYMPSINYATLVQDVTAVNLLSPRSPSSGIKQVVTTYMSSGASIKNEEFKDLMLTKDKLHEEFLSELLCTGDDLHIRLIHDIFDATIYGYVDGILSKVVKTNTIQRLAMSQSSKDIFDVIESDEKTYFRFFRWRCAQEGEALGSDCPTEMCREMRQEGWKKNLRGITIPHPHSFMKETLCDHIIGCDCSDGYMSIHLPDGQMPNDVWLNSIGGSPPYLGSMTKEKVVVGAGGKVYSSEPLIRRPINMLRSINWFVPPDSNTANIIRMLVASVSDIDPEPYAGVSEGAAGAEVHRYKDSSTSHGALTSSSYLLSTRYHISSDHFYRYCRGSDNTDLHFQALYCYLVERTNLEIVKAIRNQDPIKRFKHYKQCCYTCVKPVQDDFVDIPDDRVLTAVPSRKSNKYLFVRSDKIRILEDRSPLSRLNAIAMETQEYDTMSPRMKRLWLQDIIADKIVSDIMGQSSEETSMEASLLDVKSFERTMYLKLDPRYIIDCVMGGLSLCAEWRWLESTGHQKDCTGGEISRSVISIIRGASSMSMIGLGMFFCWEDSAARFANTYPEIVTPISNPLTIETCCNAIKTSLISLALKKRWSLPDRISIIADDEKSSMWVMKKLLYQFRIKQDKCLDCRRLISKMTSTDIRRMRTLQCRQSHKPFDRATNTPWRSSYVTVERLRKDCDSTDIRAGGAVSGHMKKMKANFCVTLITKGDIIMRPEVATPSADDPLPGFPEGFHRFSEYHLLNIDTVPTRTKSKCTVLLNPYLDDIRGREVFVVGDGLGSSGVVVALMGAKKVLTSTILDPERAIPHTYVHNISPVSLKFNLNDVLDTKTMINKMNNIMDNGWIDSWRQATADCRALVSDVEIFKREDRAMRSKALRRLLSLKEWSFAVVKDYIYSCSELAERMQIVMTSSPTSWRLITTKLRSANYPECWWILRNSRVIGDKLGLSIETGKLNRVWNNYLEVMTQEVELDEMTEREETELRALHGPEVLSSMLSHVRNWLSLPIIGLLYPTGGNFTRIYLYMKKYKQPAWVKTQRVDSTLKLYDRDYYKLRDILLCLALGLCESDQDVVTELKRTENWYLNWVEKETGVWDCELTRSTTSEGMRADIEDYLPYVRIMMIKDQLCKYSICDTIKFRPSKRGDQDIHFSISKTSYMKPSKLIKDKRVFDTE